MNKLSLKRLCALQSHIAIALFFLHIMCFATHALAGEWSGTCSDGSLTQDSTTCQFAVQSKTQAPDPSLGTTPSKGIRFNDGVSNVFFRSYSTATGSQFIPPGFFDNSSGKDLFVPQGSSPELKGFIDAISTIGVTASYAVEPGTYTAQPPSLNGCNGFTPLGIMIPQVPANPPDPSSLIVVNGYTRLAGTQAAPQPSATTTTIGSTVLGNGPIQFTYSRNDCSSDKQCCNPVTFVDAQQVTFVAVATSTRGVYQWGPQAPQNILYVSVNGGTYSVVTDCSASYAPTCVVNGQCGSSEGDTFSSAPSSNLCSTGTASTVSGSGPWIWTCAGSNGGTTASCSASTSAINGQCGSSNGGTVSSAPSSGLCSAGSASSVSGSGPWAWTCIGSDGGTTASCSASVAAKNGQCGSSNGGTFSSAPSSGLCNTGSASAVSGSGPWTWTCAGSNGGSTASCSASPEAVNGQCGSSNGGTFSSAPSSGLCDAGSASGVEGSCPWTWNGHAPEATAEQRRRVRPLRRPSTANAGRPMEARSRPRPQVIFVAAARLALYRAVGHGHGLALETVAAAVRHRVRPLRRPSMVNAARLTVRRPPARRRQDCATQARLLPFRGQAPAVGLALAATAAARLRAQPPTYVGQLKDHATTTHLLTPARRTVASERRGQEVTFMCLVAGEPSGRLSLWIIIAIMPVDIRLASITRLDKTTRTSSMEARAGIEPA